MSSTLSRSPISNPISSRLHAMRIALTSAAVALAAVLLAGVFLVEKQDLSETGERYNLQYEEITGPDDAVERFCRVLAVPTLADMTAANHISNPAPFQQLHARLERDYAAVFDAVKVEKINEYSLLLTWQGSDPALRPVLLMSHLDVVPAPDRNWTHPPFAGTLADDGFIYGRGALDTKITLAAVLEAAAQLLAANFAPQRTVYLAFGHDEEVGGEHGAAAIAAELASRGVELELVLDEGGMILADGLKAGGVQIVDGPVALVATAEKGLQDWAIRVSGTGGHSSVPPTGDGTSVAARIARVLAQLEAMQTSTSLAPPVTDFLRALAPAVRWGLLRTLLRWADNPLVNPVLGQALAAAGGRELAAMVRTTCAVVRVKAGGAARNVMPAHGEITLNLRTLPGDDEAAVRRYLTLLVRKEAPHAVVEQIANPVYPASPVSPASGPHFDLVERAILETLAPSGSKAAAGRKGGSGSGGRQRPMPVVPYLLTGMTDSRWYVGLAQGRVYRFSPLRLDRAAGDVDRVHGVDERVGVRDYLDGVRFYMRFVKLAAGGAGLGPAEGGAAEAA